MYVGLIPMRKGSVRIKGKLMKELNGIPLVNYTIAVAKASKLEKIILTTDFEKKELEGKIDLDILLHKRQEISHTQPASYYIKKVIKDYKLCDTDNIVLLQPTCPIRHVSDINYMVDLHNEDVSLPCISVAEWDTINKLYTKEGALLKSLAQETGYDDIKTEKIYMRNSSIYIFSVEYYKEHKTIFGKKTRYFVMSPYKAVDIDTFQDWHHAKCLIKGGVLE